MSLFSRNPDLPGEQGALRDCTPGGKGIKKFNPGDFAVINAANISRPEAQTLVGIEPAAVVNVAEFTTGSIPNYGPQILLDSGVTLIEDVGVDFIESFKDGKKARITDAGEIFIGENKAAEGTVLTRAAAERKFSSAERELIDHMEAFFGNATEFINAEGPLLIDGLGVPDSGFDLAGRKVLVVSPGEGHRATIKLLRNFIREYEPVILAVDAAADSLLEMGYKPDFIIGDPQSISAESLRSGAQVILPAEPDGTATGIERIQDLGIGAMTYPAATDSATDLALLLADYHRAEIIVQAGASVELDDIFADAPGATPSAMLSRLKTGRRLVDANAVINLYSAPQGGGIAWLWAIFGLLVAIAAVIIVVGVGGDGSFAQNLIDTWNNIALGVQGWFA